MVSKSQIKLITSLQQKKYRDKTGLFVAEGPKVIAELREAGLNLHSLFSTEAVSGSSETFFSVTELELQKISFLKTANTSLALFEIPKQIAMPQQGLVLALDAVRDPGNLGTIIRLCDWFGVTQLVCSVDTADCYNPKVIQATMGSIARIQVSYCDLESYIKNSKIPVYGACMEGVNVYAHTWAANGILVMGNEANGISEGISKLLHEKITIAQFGKKQEAESLNVATATAILLSEFRRSTER
ncbi:MAG: RNA methyltransferase [Altibacter sp.]|uniref:TrmH family RNA methyltransferase n=1 Tax=Altibacter sp. TaxID=2024823 RepID=UPI001DB69FC4|nr:RNA methyltransferase [Altibacter sp.]MBZ0328060.1 RNA methyltransferase [Altibacter sp.]